MTSDTLWVAGYMFTLTRTKKGVVRAKNKALGVNVTRTKDEDDDVLIERIYNELPDPDPEPFK